MKFSRYVKEHILWVVLAIFLVITTDILLMTVRGSLHAALYITGVALLCCFLGMYLEYRKSRRLFEEVKSKQDLMDKKYLAVEVAEFPESQEAEMLKDILKQSEIAMTDHVAAYRRDIEYYKDYIETWVHEIKIPISTSRMILENHKEVPLAQSGIDAEIDRIEGYVEQALYYAKSTEVEKDYFIKEIDIKAIVMQEVKKRKKSLIAMKAVMDLHDLEPDKKIKSDGKWIAFIIGQILANSMKYAKKEEALKLSIYLEEYGNDERREGGCALVIRDNGIGIKSAELGRVFDKGFTGSNGRSGRASTGIGLYLCKKLCRRLQHDICIESREGEGTAVKILFSAKPEL